MFLSPQSFLSPSCGTKSYKKNEAVKKAQDDNLVRAIKKELKVHMELVIFIANYFLRFGIPMCKEHIYSS